MRSIYTKFEKRCKRTSRLLYAVCLSLILLPSCSSITPSESIIKIIETTENKLYRTNSFEELVQLQDEMLMDMTSCLDTNHAGYRFNEGDEEYDKIIKRLDRYNVIYCRSSSRFNPELNTENGNMGKIAQVIALMRAMESRALTKSEGFKPDEKEGRALNISNSVLPTQEEIEAVNQKLPVPISEGMIFSEVEYDEKAKVLSFFYDYTKEVDENAMTPDYKHQVKQQMIDALLGTENEERLKAGMTILFIYRSIDKKKLYDISITSNDLN